MPQTDSAGRFAVRRLDIAPPQSSWPISPIFAVNLGAVVLALGEPARGRALVRYIPRAMDPLIERAQSGDREALEELLERVAPAIQRFGMRMCKNDHDSQDVLQDTLVTILRHLRDFEGRSSFTSWVFALARTACVRRRRGLKNAPSLPLDGMAEKEAAEPSPEDRVGHRELSAQLGRALDGLPEEYREAIWLRDVEGLTAAEAAESLGVSVEALKSRLHRARQALRNALRPMLESQAPTPAAACPDVMALWSRKLEGELSALDCAQMEKHLASCPACESACSALKESLLACRREANKHVPPQVQASVKAAIRAWMASNVP